ncbi:type II secretion system protein [Luteimonas terrae]|uniref:Type II secretion system protein n=1 Tax=Luteimonas terrae TaxID=1530191 RepID=A0A4R5U6V4_9GAMM|nr:type II secretion system protein [Luteimonas terrae]TDK29975.1 type II secretion system protein [Luteimonas terrae]
MRTSVFCLPDPTGSRGVDVSGFSLLEMLVVLTLVSIMVALIAPRLANTVQAIQVSGDRAETVRQIERLPLLARTAGLDLRFGPGQLIAHEGVAIPEGWTLTALTPLRVAANGICSAAKVRVTGAGVTEEWSIGAPDCRVAGHA